MTPRFQLLNSYEGEAKFSYNECVVFPLEIPVQPHIFLLKIWLLRPPPPWNFH